MMFLATAAEVNPELAQAIASALAQQAATDQISTGNWIAGATLLVSAITPALLGYWKYRTDTFVKEQKQITATMIEGQQTIATTLVKVAEQTDGIKDQLVKVVGEKEFARGTLEEKEKQQAIVSPNTAEKLAETVAEKVAQVAEKVARGVVATAEKVAIDKIDAQPALTEQTKKEIKDEIKSERVAGVFDKDATEKMKKEIKAEVKDEIEIISEVVKEKT